MPFKRNVSSGNSVNGEALRSNSARRPRISEILSSSVGMDTIDEMDSTEAMALKGQGMGQR